MKKYVFYLSVLFIFTQHAMADDGDTEKQIQVRTKVGLTPTTQSANTKSQ